MGRHWKFLKNEYQLWNSLPLFTSPRAWGWRRTMTSGWIMKGILTASSTQGLSVLGWGLYWQGTGSESFSPMTTWRKRLKLKEGNRMKSHIEKTKSKKLDFGGHQTEEAIWKWGFGADQMQWWIGKQTCELRICLCAAGTAHNSCLCLLPSGPQCTGALAGSPERIWGNTCS